jgi:hypothetical protein
MLGPRFLTSLRSAIAASVALLIALAFQWPFPYWAAIMVIVIMSPSFSAGIPLFPVRLAGVATGATLGFLAVAFFGQDRIPFLVASSAILFIFGVGASSPAYGPFFSMGESRFLPWLFSGTRIFRKPCSSPFIVLPQLRSACWSLPFPTLSSGPDLPSLPPGRFLPPKTLDFSSACLFEDGSRERGSVSVPRLLRQCGLKSGRREPMSRPSSPAFCLPSARPCHSRVSSTLWAAPFAPRSRPSAWLISDGLRSR